jgi:hypothetical protein
VLAVVFVVTPTQCKSIITPTNVFPAKAGICCRTIEVAAKLQVVALAKAALL